MKRTPNPQLDKLLAAFPVLRDRKPLALGIHKAIRERMPDIPVDELRTALRIHTTSTQYLKGILIGRERFDLDGNAAGEVTEEHRKVADGTLRDRFRKSALREKEKRSAKAAEEEAAAQAEKRAAKLNQLAERFNRNRG